MRDYSDNIDAIFNSPVKVPIQAAAGAMTKHMHLLLIISHPLLIKERDGINFWITYLQRALGEAGI